MSRILLIFPTSTYRASAFMAATVSLNIEPVIATDRKQVLADLVPNTTLALNLHKPVLAVNKIMKYAQAKPFSAIVGVDEETVILAAMASKALDLPHNPITAVQATRDKFLMRQKLQTHGLLSPKFEKFQVDQDAGIGAKKAGYPCVLKPISLSASRGVIRANTEDEFLIAFQMIRDLLSDPEIIRQSDNTQKHILVEDYIPGNEYAVEGVLIDGELKILALFDKPDPLEGPYFAETIYVTPSKLSHKQQEKIFRTIGKAAKAIGLQRGPIHAELRLNENGVYVIEIANRTIGGYCSEVLKFSNGISLEDVVLMNAIGMDISYIKRETQAAGVMMIPPPSAGIFQEVKSKDRALQVEGIESIIISIPIGQKVEVLPKSSRYLGFIFARGESPEFVENAIREAYGELEILIQPNGRTDAIPHSNANQ